MDSKWLEHQPALHIVTFNIRRQYGIRFNFHPFPGKVVFELIQCQTHLVNIKLTFHSQRVGTFNKPKATKLFGKRRDFGQIHTKIGGSVRCPETHICVVNTAENKSGQAINIGGIAAILKLGITVKRAVIAFNRSTEISQRKVMDNTGTIVLVKQKSTVELLRR